MKKNKFKIEYVRTYNYDKDGEEYLLLKKKDVTELFENKEDILQGKFNHFDGIIENEDVIEYVDTLDTENGKENFIRKCGMWFNVGVKNLIKTGQTHLMNSYEIIDYIEYLKYKRLEK
jgi:hypothetical protein